ncbi:phytosulfokines 3 [Phtheirospermum japonicum]|uniref:Phytosulfokine n=1 Tax=Phtheirospermum japonicum TaxID=374723 RepID=A0A830AWL6_9LAMI|nr:phytosulfokines 3 [Phtheirospermum japonicum]
MSKPTTVFLVALLLCFTLCSAARRPPLHDKVVAEHQVKTEEAHVEESCQGIGDEECLMRRDLVAHLDYIYTQRHNKP